MKTLIRINLALLLILIAVITIAATANAASRSPAIERNFKVTTKFVVQERDGKYLYGSTGTAWKVYGRYLVTNKHVALGCAAARVCSQTVTDHTGKVHIVRVVGVSYDYDIAVFESLDDIPGTDPTFDLALPTAGQGVFAVGFPEGIFRVSDKCTVVDGLVVGILDIPTSSSFNCYIRGGSSGSAVYADGTDHVVGLVFAASRDNTIGYFIPSSIVFNEVKFIIENPSVIQKPAADVQNFYEGIPRFQPSFRGV
jgi:S1-C subfamily serine protease